MKRTRKILGTVIAASIAIGAIPLVRIPTKAMEDTGGVTPSREVKTIMRGTTGMNRQTTVETETIDETKDPPTYKYTYTCEKGSSIYYGSYPQTKLKEAPQDSTGENVDWVHGYSGEDHEQDEGYYAIEPIEWRVLANNSKEGLFLLSEKNIDTVRYNETYDPMKSYPWSRSTIRSWLNGYTSQDNDDGKNYSGKGYGENFIGTAFTEKERGKIDDSEIKTGENKDYPGVEDNSTVEDKIFLLSVGEVTGTGEEIEEGVNATYDYGFKTDPGYNGVDDWYQPTDNHIAINSQYVQNGCGKTGYTPYNYDGPEGAGRWWLRSPGYGE